MDKKEVMTLMNCSLNDNLSLNLEDVNGLVSGLAENNTGFNTADGGIAQNTDNALYHYDNGLYDGSANYTCWDYWRNDYYPRIIRESYPVYIQERAKDKGKQAFEIIKILKDKKLVQLKTVGNFIDLMDELIKIL
ncbi:unnamed protein product [marine sediment metagenome]|uniref:Uncharacterized protein n=1 Tax=marine sediment metagenome TaxID=412755 RepID=X1U1T4_9ZZZZ